MIAPDIADDIANKIIADAAGLEFITVDYFRSAVRIAAIEGVIAGMDRVLEIKREVSQEFSGKPGWVEKP